MSLGKRLAKARNDAGLTQEALAAATGLTRPHIQKIESDIHSPTISTLEALLKACHLSLGRFFESKIPEEYADSEAQRLHEELEEIRETGGEYLVGIRLNIDAIHEKIRKEARAEHRTRADLVRQTRYLKKRRTDEKT